MDQPAPMVNLPRSPLYLLLADSEAVVSYRASYLVFTLVIKVSRGFSSVFNLAQ